MSSIMHIIGLPPVNVSYIIQITQISDVSAVNFCIVSKLLIGQVVNITGVRTTRGADCCKMTFSSTAGAPSAVILLPASLLSRNQQSPAKKRA